MSRPLGDNPARSYAPKLDRFAQFAEPELRQIFHDLALPTGAAVLDVGCGTGLATAWLAKQLGATSLVVGLDLSWAHLEHARQHHSAALVQADVSRLCFRRRAFDLVWCCNTINHLADPLAALGEFATMLAGRGRIALGQSSLLPEMFFAWDYRLDDEVRAACHAYYRDKYRVSRDETRGVRGLLGLLRRAGCHDTQVRTYVIERTHPLKESDRAYFVESVFTGYWGPKLEPYLSAEAWQSLKRLTDPSSPTFCLDRPDFHHLQTLTVFQCAV